MQGRNDKTNGNRKEIPGDDDHSEDDKIVDNLSVFGPLIEKATGISPDELRGFDPAVTRRNIPTRMVWASKRITTRGGGPRVLSHGCFRRQLLHRVRRGPQSARSTGCSRRS